MRLDPQGDPVWLAPVLAAAWVDGVRLVAWRTGDLDVAFADGSVLHAPRSEDAYEAWTLNGADGLLAVSMPAGSGLSVGKPQA